MEQAGLMTEEQYKAAEEYLISWMQLIHEKMHGHVIVPDSPAKARRIQSVLRQNQNRIRKAPTMVISLFESNRVC